MSKANPELIRSARIDDWFYVENSGFGVPEGDAAEWREVAGALRAARGMSVHKRLAVRPAACEWRLWSPRNAAGTNDFVAVPDPEAFADHVDRVLDAYSEVER